VWSEERQRPASPFEVHLCISIAGTNSGQISGFELPEENLQKSELCFRAGRDVRATSSLKCFVNP